MRLKSIVSFVGVPALGTVSLPHGLNLTGPVVPDECKKSNAGFVVVTADDTTVTVTNATALPADCDVLCEHWHTVERAFGDQFTSDNGVNLTPQPFVDDNNIASLIASVDLQDAYNDTVGSPATIQLDTTRDGIRFADVAGQGTPSFEVTGANSSADSIMVTRTFAGGGIGIDISMGAGTTGTLLNGALAGTGFGINLSKTGGGANALVNLLESSTLGTGVMLNLLRTNDSIAIMTSIARQPATAGTTGENVRISTNANAIGHGLRLIGGTLAGMTLVTLNLQAAGAGLRILEDIPGAANTGIALEITRTLTGSTGVLLSISKTPAAATAGTGINITYGVNTTGAVMNFSQSGSGNVIVITGSGAGALLSFLAIGAGQVATWTHSGTNANPFSWSNSSNTAGISTTFTRLPTVATGGSIFRLSSNASFTGINLEIIQSAVGGSDQGIELVTRGSGIGCRIHDQAGSLHTGTALRLQHDVTGSTGLLLELLKSPAAVTIGDLCSITAGTNASGNVWAVTHSGSGDYESITQSGAGRYLTLAHTGAGEVWRITGAAGAIRTILDTVGRLGVGNFVPTSPARVAYKDHAAFTGSEAQHTTGSGTTVGAVAANLITVTLNDNTTYLCECWIEGRDAAGVNRSVYIARALVFRQAAGVATFGAASPANSFTDETAAGLDGTFTVAVNDVRVTVTGVAGNTINWTAKLFYQGVSTAV